MTEYVKIQKMLDVSMQSFRFTMVCLYEYMLVIRMYTPLQKYN